MSIPVRIDDELYEQAKSTTKIECRIIVGQIEFWAKIGKAALDNPDLPIEFIRDLMIARRRACLLRILQTDPAWVWKRAST